MGDISAHFSRSEFACTDGCGCCTVDTELLTLLETIRQHFDASVTITSGHRCPKWNRRINGSKSSLHLQGRAADIQVEGVAPADVQDYFDQIWPEAYGMGRYETWTHIDSRGGPAARWSK